MADIKFQLLIPTLNNVSEIDETLNSICEQNYSKENIFINVMDFGSLDGTYEKLLGYGYERLGIYKDTRIYDKWQMTSKLFQTVDYVRGIYGGGLFFAILYPGDVLYPDYLKVCNDLIKEHNGEINSIICETDLWDSNHEVSHQKRLYENNREIDGNTELKEYVDKGYDHQVQCMSNVLGYGNSLPVHEMNEQRWWNCCSRMNWGRKAFYSRDVLCCQRHVVYDDEMEAIVRRWGLLGNVSRSKRFNQNFVLTDYYDAARKSASQYALWRSGEIIKSDFDVAKDCFIISEVIWNSIVETPEYKRIKQVFEKLEQH